MIIIPDIVKNGILIWGIKMMQCGEKVNIDESFSSDGWLMSDI